jgi:hypothetical protein
LKNAPKEPASIATADIAYACRKTSSKRAGVEIGFGSWDETVRSWVLVQKRCRACDLEYLATSSSHEFRLSRG